MLTQIQNYNGDGLPSVVADGAATLNAAGVPTSAAHTISYAYDLDDRLTTTTYADSSQEVLTLDHNGQVLQRVNRGNLKTTYTYDAMGRVTNETDQSFSAPFVSTFDLVGRPLTVNYSAGTFTYAYDSAGRQSRTTRPDGLAIGYTYDRDSNTSTITYPDSTAYSYAYDELDRMTDVTEVPTGAGAQTKLVHYAYDPLSRRTSNTFGNGTVTAYTYDPFSAIASVAHTFVGAAPANGVTVTYQRDYLERRTSDTASVSTYVWHPPANANVPYSANANNQYTAINGQTLGYDPNGNLLTDPTAPLGNATYGFDQENRLTSAKNAQHSAGYTYDPFNRRAGKTVDGVGTVFVDDGDREIADYDTSGHELTRFVYGLDAAPVVEEPVSATGVPSDTWYHHLDALGTTLAITNHAGTLLHAYSASPWGELGGGTIGTPFRYAGMRTDPETLLDYDHARYYSPQQGRFISPDPIGVKGGTDIYAYVGNDPLNGTDPTGLIRPSWTDICGGDGPACFWRPPPMGGGGGSDIGSGTPIDDTNLDSSSSFGNTSFGQTGTDGYASLAAPPPAYVPAYDPSAASSAEGQQTATGGNEGQPTGVGMQTPDGTPVVLTSGATTSTDSNCGPSCEQIVVTGHRTSSSTLSCALSCIVENDPFGPGVSGPLLGLGGTFPKSWVGQPRALGSSQLTTYLSALANEMFSGKNLPGTTGAAMRSTGRFYSPFMLGYGAYMAGVEFGCAIECSVR